jgi:hypothetical protein
MGTAHPPDRPSLLPPTHATFWREFEGRSRPSMGGTGGYSPEILRPVNLATPSTPHPT